VTPLAIFLWNKHHCLNKVFRSLELNKEFKKTKIYIFIDYTDPSSEEYAASHILKNKLNKYSQYKNIKLIFRTKKFGLRKNIIDGITYLLKFYRQVIILEDDLIVSKDFLNYMNQSLNFYRNNKSILSISAFNHKDYESFISENYKYDNFFSKRASSWGWGTWRNRWEMNKKKISYLEIKKNKKKIINFLGQDVYFSLLNINLNNYDLWAANWCFVGLKKNMYTAYPVKSKISNIGFDGTGQGGYSNKFTNSLNFKLKKNFNLCNYIDSSISKSQIQSDKFISRFNQNIFIQYVKYFMPLSLKKFIKNIFKKKLIK
jgi:hypothetical protein